MDIKKEIEIHTFCDELWQRTIDEHGEYTDDIDEIVLGQASEKFGLDRNVIVDVFHKIDRIKIAISGEFTAENLRKALKEYESELKKNKE